MHACMTMIVCKAPVYISLLELSENVNTRLYWNLWHKQNLGHFCWTSDTANMFPSDELNRYDTLCNPYISIVWHHFICDSSSFQFSWFGTTERNIEPKCSILSWIASVMWKRSRESVLARFCFYFQKNPRCRWEIISKGCCTCIVQPRGPSLLKQTRLAFQ